MVKRHLWIVGFTFIGLCLTIAPTFGQALNITDDFSADPTAGGVWSVVGTAAWKSPGLNKCDDGMGNFAPQNCGAGGGSNMIPVPANEPCSLFSADDWTDIGEDPATAAYIAMTAGLGQRGAIYNVTPGEFTDFEIIATIENTQGCRHERPADGMGFGIWEVPSVPTLTGHGGGGNGLSGVVCPAGTPGDGPCEFTDGNGDTVEDGGQTIAFEADTNGSNFGDSDNSNHIMVAYSTSGFPNIDSLPLDNAALVQLPPEIPLHNHLGPADHEVNRAQFTAQFKNGVAGVQLNMLDQGVDFGQIIIIVLNGYSPFTGVIGATGATGGRDQHSILHNIEVSGPLGACDLIGPVVGIEREIVGLRDVECGDVAPGDNVLVRVGSDGNVRNIMGCANGDLVVTEVVPLGLPASAPTNGGVLTLGDAMAGENDTIEWNVAAADAGTFSAQYNVSFPVDFSGAVTFVGSAAEAGGESFGTSGDSFVVDTGGFGSAGCNGLACWNILGALAQPYCGFTCMPTFVQMREDFIQDGAGTTEANFNWGPGSTISPDLNGASSSTAILPSRPHTGNDIAGGTLNDFGWKDPDTQINFNGDAIGNNPDNCVAYAQCYVTNNTGSPMSVRFRMDASKCPQVLLNGTEILINNDCPGGTDCRTSSQGACRSNPKRPEGTTRPSATDDPFSQIAETTSYDETQPIILNAGINSLVVKTFAGQGSRSKFDFWAHFQPIGATGPTDSIGEPDISISLSRGIGLLPGDNNGDSRRDISDPIVELNFLFGSGALPSCLLAGPGVLAPIGIIILDYNGDGGVNIGDPVSDLNFQFGSGGPHNFGTVCRKFAEGGCDENCTAL